MIKTKNVLCPNSMILEEIDDDFLEQLGEGQDNYSCSSMSPEKSSSTLERRDTDSSADEIMKLKSDCFSS